MKESTDGETNKTQKARVVICACLALAIIITVGGFIGYKFIKHEQNQNARIALHEERIVSLEERIASHEERISKLNADVSSANTEDIEWLDDGYNYLAIGNSLTLHGIGSYWWNEVGMAASDIDHDYFHIVSAYLEKGNPTFLSVPYNFAVWETQSHDRDETLKYLDHYLDSRLDLITVQLGENVSDLTTYEEDYVSLINYLKEKAPNARILVVGDFWSQDNRNDLEIHAATTTEVEYVTLDGITDNNDYYCGLGTTVYDSEGNEHTVEHSGVAKHPGDKGMQAIADRIINALK